MLTAKELSEYIGKSGYLVCEGGKLLVKVECHDVRQQWGRVDVNVRPKIKGAGVGSVWVSVGRVQWAEGE